ncbi:MAG: hypothetical protein U0Q18_20650 [Bryobacteraceae bacterium]
MADTARYRKLPGHSRGFIFSATLWNGADHILSVKSNRVQEHYKRFYFRDIQGIVVTRVPRFRLATGVILLALVLLTFILYSTTWMPAATMPAGLALIAIAGIWLYVSVWQSCTCRLYTAVSREDLPSVYRLWTARKLLAAVEPQILKAQGSFTESWTEAAEFYTLGPAKSTSPGTVPTTRSVVAHSRTLASDLFLAGLLADSIAVFWGLRAQNSVLTTLSAGFTLVQVGAAVWMLIQRHRGTLARAMQVLAIIGLLFIGGTMYAETVATSFNTALSRTSSFRGSSYAQASITAIRQIYSAGTLLLAAAGVMLSFRSSRPERPASMAS